MPRITEHPHYTDEQVHEHITKALHLVDELDTPEDLRGLAFAKAVDLYSAKQRILEQVDPALGGLLSRGH